MDPKRLRRAQEFANLVDRYRPGRTAWLLRAHRTTLARWAKGEVEIPTAALRLLRLMATGNVPGMAGKWDGWRFADGELWSPDNERFSPSDLTALRCAGCAARPKRYVALSGETMTEPTSPRSRW